MFYLLATVLFSLLMAVFAMQNTIPVMVNLGFWSVEASLALIIIAAAAVGILAATPVWIMMQVQLRFRLLRANSRNNEVEAELGKIRRTAILHQANREANVTPIPGTGEGVL